MKKRHAMRAVFLVFGWVSLPLGEGGIFAACRRKDG